MLANKIPAADRVVLAPMIRGSELAFRRLINDVYGPTMVCYSPMLRADVLVDALRPVDPTGAILVQQQRQQQHEDYKLFAQDCRAAAGEIDFVVSERLVVQLCGNAPATLARACRLLLQHHSQPRCNNTNNTLDNHQQHLVGIDLNLGCPQSCARDGQFGAFLPPALAIQCVQQMRQAIDGYYCDDDHDDDRTTTAALLSSSSTTAKCHGSNNTTTTNTNNEDKKNQKKIQLSCKLRLQETVEETIVFAQALRAAGCDVLAVHCRRRDAKFDGAADLDAGRAIVAALPGMPVYLNGADVTCWSDVEKILAQTGAAKLMVARPLLADPDLFIRDQNVLSADAKDDGADEAHAATAAEAAAVHVAARYLDMAAQYAPPTAEYIRVHLKWFFRTMLRPTIDQHGAVAADFAHNMRYKLWNFLQRPYLQSLEQFRAFTVLLCHTLHIPVPPSLLLITVAPSSSSVETTTCTILRPTFKSIRHMNKVDNNKRKRVEETVPA
jgi:tRNA-dihydrouridine synthase